MRFVPKALSSPGVTLREPRLGAYSSLLEHYSIPQCAPILRTEAPDTLRQRGELRFPRDGLASMSSEYYRPWNGRKERRDEVSELGLVLLAEEVEERGCVEGGDVPLERRE